MGALEIIGIVIEVIKTIWDVFFGPKTLQDLRKEWQAKRRQSKPPILRETGETEVPVLSKSSPPRSTDLQTYFDKVVQDVRGPVSSSQYEKAVRTAERYRREMVDIGDKSKLDFLLALGELDVWYAHAQIYTGETTDAIKRAEQVIANLKDQGQRSVTLPLGGSQRWNLVLGLAHNHIGYANWMELGHYEVALREFSASIPYFLAGECQKQLATAYDNMGRVYAQLGCRTRAELLIEHGRLLRQDDDYRYALSLNSSAIAYLAFGQLHRAFVLSEEALEIFNEQKEEKGERGVGLALIAKGQALRLLGARWKRYRPSNRKGREECRRYVNDAIVVLEEAGAIFEDKVKEPIRLFQTYNELGCAYRERMDLDKSEGDTASARGAERYLRRSIELVGESIKLVEGKNLVLYVDACEDLAQTYFRGGKPGKANEWIKRAEEAIPDRYKLQKNVGMQSIPPMERVEDYWQQLGKLYMLRAHIKFDKVPPAGYRDDKFRQTLLKEALEDYTLAAGYFGRFLERPPSRPQLANHRLFIEQVYDRLRLLRVEDLQYIQEVLRTSEETYKLKSSWLTEFYEDTLGLLLQVNTTRSAAQ